MATKPVFAQGTEVPVGKTKGEIETLLQKHGSAQILMGSDRASGEGFVAFTLAERQFRIVVKRRQPPAPKRFSYRARETKATNPEQLEREQWRALLLVLKAKLELVARGDTTVQQEFLAHLVLPSGATVGEEIAPHVDEAYRTGVQPLFGFTSGPRQLGAG